MEKMEHKQVGEVLSFENNENTCRNVYIHINTYYNIFIFTHFTHRVYIVIYAQSPHHAFGTFFL